MMTKETKEGNMDQVSIVPMGADHYTDFEALAQSAWPGIGPNAEFDFVAMTDHGVSTAAFDGTQMVGASLNLLKPSELRGEMHLLVHMLATHQNAQGKGVGRKLMRANYDLVTSGQLGEQVREVRLTSDPLEAKNVMFYLRHNGMHVMGYKLDAYKSLSQAGGEQHRGLPADRFVYAARPGSGWVQRRVLPTPVEYNDFLLNRPETVLTLGSTKEDIRQRHSSPVLFVEVPLDMAAIKERDKNEGTRTARQWVEFNAQVYGELLSPQHGYQVVDATLASIDQEQKQYVVAMRHFDDQDPDCLVKVLLSD